MIHIIHFIVKLVATALLIPGAIFFVLIAILLWKSYYIDLVENAWVHIWNKDKDE